MPQLEKGKQKLPSSNWMALQQKLKPSTSLKSHGGETPRKRRRTEHYAALSTVVSESAFPRGTEQPVASTSSLPADDRKNGESLEALRKMVSGQYEYTAAQKLPGKYLAMDCEMVGVGAEGKESSLARVSIVNFYGALQMDEFVRQKERVVDYRTEFSGIRPSDMVKAKSFEEVQKQVADLVKDRIIVGHAIHNDLKALLLSHPRPLIRDTQVLAGRHKLMKTRRPALRHLAQQEVGVTIQTGEHSSVVDARATMAIYRLHRKTWEVDMPHPHLLTSKRSRAEVEDSEDVEGVDVTKEKPEVQKFPGGGRKGISSGLSTIVKRRGETKTKTSWWKEVGGGSKRTLP